MTEVPFLELRGDPYEIGRAQGEALRDDIAASLETLLSLEGFRLLKPWWLPGRSFVGACRRRAMNTVWEPLRRHYPDQARGFEGLAAGSGLPLDALILVASAEILLARIDHRRAPRPGACCAVAVGRPDGVELLKNFDYPAAIAPYYCVRASRPKEGHALLEFTVAPLAGTVDGLNERGLAVTYDYAFCTDAVEAPVPLTVTLNAMLRSCATVEEAVAFLRGRPRSGGALLMLADAGGAFASVELSNTRLAVRTPPDGARSLAHANHYAAPELVEVEVPADAVYTRRNVTPLRGMPVHRSSHLRKARLEERLGSGPEPVRDVMKDHGPGGKGDDDTVCRHGPYWETTASLELRPASGTLRLAHGKPCETEPREFRLR